MEADLVLLLQPYESKKQEGKFVNVKSCKSKLLQHSKLHFGTVHNQRTSIFKIFGALLGYFPFHGNKTLGDLATVI